MSPDATPSTTRATQALPMPAPADPAHTAPQDKRSLKQAFRESPPAAGVYAIRHRASGRLLLGGSLNVEGTLNRHRFELKMRAHRCRPLQADWLAQGDACFDFEVIDTVKERDDPEFDRAVDLRDLLALWDDDVQQRGVARYGPTVQPLSGDPTCPR